jgi:hypothetical protein
LSREDAERAVKELDGKDLRGQAVRVDLFNDVRTFPLIQWGCAFNVLASVTLIITAVMIAATSEKTDTGTSVPETIVTEMSATATTAMTVTVKKRLLSDAIGLILLPAVAKRIVAPGHPPSGGILKIKGLQGTMIDGGAMMTGEVLTLIMIVAGTTAGMIAAATKRKNGMMTGLPDTMGTAGGVEGGCRVVVPSKMKGTERNGRPIPPTDEVFLLSSAFFASFFARISSRTAPMLARWRWRCARGPVEF